MTVATPLADNPDASRPEPDEIRALRANLAEAEEKLEALRTGAVDALVVHGPDGPKVYVLQSADHPYRLLIEQMPDAALTLDHGGNVLYCNPRFAELVRCDSGSIVGKALREFVLADDHVRLHEAFGVARKERSLAELRLSAADGQLTRAQFAFSALHTEQFDGVCLIVTDLTGHYRAQDLLASGRKKDEFMAMLAHEFRNPLAPIRNAVAILRLLEPRDEERFVQARELIGRQAEHLTRLVDDLLDVSRITQGKINLRMAPVDVNRVLSGGVEIARPLIEEYKHRLTLKPLMQPAFVIGDFTRLVQVVGNLLNNAAKYTPPGGEIAASVEKNGDWIAIRVEDNGIGIAADVLPHVFELFTQAPRSPDRAPGGLGVGLSLVKTIVQLHGGSAAANSGGPRKGSEFVVRLPASATAHEAKTSDPLSSTVKRRRVLIVDDNRDAADSMATLLRIGGHEVHVAYNGLSGLSLAFANEVDVALIDIGLPGIDGHEVARRLRRHDRTARMVLVALTGYGRDEDRSISRTAGFDHHLVKPVQWELLEQVLQKE
ncbi:MAG TPA: ATP-binding protein [Casimicrobiaceae bacterium]|nr:ATP-binding protein [Casimicrobiaceae bacterium]